MNRKLILAIAGLGLALVAAAQKPNYELAERFSQKNINRMVFSTRITPNYFASSDKFWYTWTTPDGTNYYIVDPETGRKTEIFNRDELAMKLTTLIKDPFEAKHLSIRGLALKDDKTFKFSVPSTALDSAGKKKTFYFEYDIASGNLTDVSATEKNKKSKYPRWASVSPDGTMGVYVKNDNLFYMDSTSLRKAAANEKDSTIVEHRLTRDGIKDFSWGESFENSMGGEVKTDTTKRSRAYNLFWSPDSKHFVAEKWDMRKIMNLWVIHHTASPRPTLESYKYLMPGEEGPEGDMFMFEMPSGESRKIKTHAWKNQGLEPLWASQKKADQYKEYHSMTWMGDNNGLYVYRTSRDLKRIDLCYLPVQGDSLKPVIEERFNSYIETRRPKFVKNGTEFIFWSERNGWANLYLYKADGTLIRNLTPGAFHVEDVLGVDEKTGMVIFSACGMNKDENPYQMHTYKVSLAGGAIQQLDIDDMDVLSTASEDGRFVVANYSRVDYAPAVMLINTTTGKRTELEKADLSLLYAAGYKMPERFKVKAADGITDLWGVMYKPFDFDSTKVYPICDYVYPGPQVEANNISWSKGMTRVDRLAQLGFIVVTVGNRGGHPNRSKWYHNYGYGNLRDYGLEDQKYAIQQLGRMHSYINLDKVGIHGHSGGGFMSTAAILTYPDFFKAAVSCAGNHDNSIYNRWWSETHHGVLEKVSNGDTTFVYSIKVNQELAKNLKGHLMLVTGDVDNNVHPANTYRVVDALIRANKRFDMLVLPGQRHGFGDMNEYFFWRMADHYSKWLKGESLEHEVDIKELNND